MHQEYLIDVPKRGDRGYDTKKIGEVNVPGLPIIDIEIERLPMWIADKVPIKKKKLWEMPQIHPENYYKKTKRRILLLLLKRLYNGN